MQKTTDIWFASFLQEIKGYQVHDFTVIKPGKGEFRFDLTEEQWKQFKLEFDHSDFSKLKYGQERLKDLIY